MTARQPSLRERLSAGGSFQFGVAFKQLVKFFPGIGQVWLQAERFPKLRGSFGVAFQFNQCFAKSKVGWSEAWP